MSIDVKNSEFESSVIQKSFEIPVLVDFWAAWCNPCRVLGPILEELERSMAGKFILAKINTETEPQLAGRFNISSIPSVALFFKGAIKDTFTGALPREHIERFLIKNLPNEEIAPVQSLMDSGSFREAGRIILEKKLKSADFDEIIWKIIQNEFLADPDIVFVENICNQMSDFGSPFFDHKQKLKSALSLAHETACFQKFLLISKPETKLESLDYFIESISTSSGDEKENLKTCLFAGFLLLGDDPLVNEYRKKLSRALF